MHNAFMKSVVALGVLACSPILFAQTTAKPGSTGKAFDPHDLSGVWTRTKGLGNMGNDGIPRTPAGQKAFDANKPSFGPRAVVPAFGNDPMGTCDPLGLPRSLFLEVAGRSFEFVPTAKGDRILQFFEWQHQFRTIWMDGRELPKDPDPHWNGWAVGHWDGDTLVVESTGYDPRTWLDMLGNAHSDQLKVEERYKRISHDQLQQTLTFTDPMYLSKPWVSDVKLLTLNQEKGMDEKLETFCVPTEEEEFNRRVRNPASGLKP